jgi:hypothetical protein
MMSTPYWSSPMAKLITCVGSAEALPFIDSIGIAWAASDVGNSAGVVCISLIVPCPSHRERFSAPGSSALRSVLELWEVPSGRSHFKYSRDRILPHRSN